ncbi:MAG: hypothetical protein JO275_07735, partial [Verrucomicrobia bacterium]|nr:hypothetical protein [Verrucomicrobiota bacterium]
MSFNLFFQVTVCVAAISQDSTGQGLMMTGASDRMLTAGDIEFEPEQSKIQPLTTSIALMLAGDSAIQREIVQSVFFDVVARIKSEPKNWWKVSDVAELYVRYFNEAKLRRAETEILAPLGLNR